MSYLVGRLNHFMLWGCDSTQRIVSVTPEEMSAQAFSVPDRMAACSLLAFTVRHADRS